MRLEFGSQRNESAKAGQLEVQPPSEDSEATLGLVDESLLESAVEAQLMIDDPFSFEKVQIARDMERKRQLT